MPRTLPRTMPRTIPRTLKGPTPPPPARWVQTEMFPRPLVYDALDPRAVGGTRTRVQGVYLAREFAGAPQHRVFNDRHGWYCEEHGPACMIVGLLRRALGEQATA